MSENSKWDRVERILRASRTEDVVHHPSENWQHNLMTAVRARKSEPSRFDLVATKLAWQLSAGSLLFSALLRAYLALFPTVSTVQLSTWSFLGGGGF